MNVVCLLFPGIIAKNCESICMPSSFVNPACGEKTNTYHNPNRGKNTVITNLMQNEQEIQLMIWRVKEKMMYPGDLYGSKLISAGIEEWTTTSQAYHAHSFRYAKISVQVVVFF